MQKLLEVSLYELFPGHTDAGKGINLYPCKKACDFCDIVDEFFRTLAEGEAALQASGLTREDLRTLYQSRPVVVADEEEQIRALDYTRDFTAIRRQPDATAVLYFYFA